MAGQGRRGGHPANSLGFRSKPSLTARGSPVAPLCLPPPFAWLSLPPSLMPAWCDWMRAVVVLDLQESDFAPERPAGEARGVDLPPLVMLKMKMREWKLWRVGSFPCQLRQAWEQGLLESWEKEKKCARWVESTSQEVAWPRETARLQSKVSSKGKSHQRGWTRQQSRSAEKLGSSQLDLLWWKNKRKGTISSKD